MTTQHLTVPVHRDQWQTAKSANYSDDGACFVRLLDMTDVEIIARLTIGGDPTSKARARFTNYGSPGRMYTPQKTRDAEKKVAQRFRQAAPNHEPDGDSAYGLACIFFPATQQRRDVDNMLKLISDGLNGIAYDDDSQVYEITGRRGHDLPENARTEVLVYRLGRTHRRLQRCKTCDESFEVFPGSRRTYCSVECTNSGRRKQRTCDHCGESFVHKKSETKRRYCSASCREQSGHIELQCEVCGDRFDCYRSWQRKNAYCGKLDCRKAVDARVHRERRSKSFPGTCLVCGSGTTRKEYKRCNPCKLSGKRVPE